MPGRGKQEPPSHQRKQSYAILRDATRSFAIIRDPGRSHAILRDSTRYCVIQCDSTRSLAILRVSQSRVPAYLPTVGLTPPSTTTTRLWAGIWRNGRVATKSPLGFFQNTRMLSAQRRRGQCERSWNCMPSKRLQMQWLDKVLQLSSSIFKNPYKPKGGISFWEPRTGMGLGQH